MTPRGSAAGARRSPLQIAIGAAFLAASLFYLFYALKIRVPPIGDDLGPRFFPLMLGGLFLLVCLANIGVDLFAPRPGADEHSRSLDVRVGTAGVFAAAVVYALALPYLGYLVSTALLIAIFLRLLRFGGPLLIALWAVLLTAAFYLVFDTWLGVNLPTFDLWAA